MSGFVLHEHGSEPVRGLPGPLPEGERLLWQGSPEWWPLAVRAYRLRAVALYFLALWVIGFIAGLRDGATAIEAAYALVPLTLLAFTALGLLMLLAFVSARVTVYSITSRRVVIRGGVALPISINLPFPVVASAGLRRFGRTGDLALRLLPPHRVSYLLLWPHARPWHWREPEPSLRALRDADAAAQILARALAASAGQAVPVVGGLDDAAASAGPAPVPA
ncbi:MAG: photosynthetic complex putative assembly protein PuhB [Acetobacteraceae bacterium]